MNDRHDMNKLVVVVTLPQAIVNSIFNSTISQVTNKLHATKTRRF